MTDSRWFALMASLWVIVLTQTHGAGHWLALAAAVSFAALAFELDRHALNLVVKRVAK